MDLYPSGPADSKGQDVHLSARDLIVVPGIGFDGTAPIGFGSGFYDRTLAKSPAFTIGLAYGPIGQTLPARIGTTPSVR